MSSSGCISITAAKLDKTLTDAADALFWEGAMMGMACGVALVACENDAVWRRA
jgi:hypothetical protein